MTASTQLTNTEIFTFIAVLVFKLLSRKVLFITEKTIPTVKSRQISREKYCKIINSWNEKFSG